MAAATPPYRELLDRSAAGHDELAGVERLEERDLQPVRPGLLGDPVERREVAAVVLAPDGRRPVEMGQAVAEAIGASDSLLLGRRTYEEWAAFWPQQDPSSDPFVSVMNETPTFVASTTLEKVGWQSSTLLEADLAGAVSAR